MSDHHADDSAHVAFGVLTVSSTRTLDEDPGGDAIVGEIEAESHSVARRELVSDDERAIRERVSGMVDHAAVEAVITTGGTGLTPDDVTPEAVRPLFDRHVPGFGEQFRARSVEDVGPHGLLTRATAGVVDGVPVFCLPGSEQAAAFGTTELVAPIVGHVVGLTGTEGERGMSDGETALTHTDESGTAQMVDVGEKRDSKRRAVARGEISLQPSTVDAVRDDGIEKGDVLATARIGAIQAVKHTWETVPMCHQIPVTNVDTEFTVETSTIELGVTVETVGKTGCEMEALQGVTTGLNVVWDMVKAAEKDENGQYPDTAIEGVRVVEKVKERP
jgi:cyclic pyranopterin phosphate synthase